MPQWDLIPSKSFNITTEFDQLTHVVIGTTRGYYRNPDRVEIVNTTQQFSFDAVDHPDSKQLDLELSKFCSILEEYGVQVYHPVLTPGSVQDQTRPRDIGFIIGDALVISNTQNQSRQKEFEGIRHLIAQWDGRIILIPDSIYLEGGDVIIDGHRIFIGSGQRSSVEAADFIKKNFDKDFDIIPMACKSTLDGEDILHLDCAFNVLGQGHVLIYPEAFVSVPKIIHEKYSWIEVTKSEASALATNVFSINPNTVVVRQNPQCERVNAILKQLGYNIIELVFDGVPATGGSFRCVTLPLRRIEIRK
ncbi:MAG: hypothetical protein GY761_22060 [Hyphomicrobiales bacterium]|nr:hypothetical protein [Hyphomicrobiales bacterium]